MIPKDLIEYVTKQEIIDSGWGELSYCWNGTYNWIWFEKHERTEFIKDEHAEALLENWLENELPRPLQINRFTNGMWRVRLPFEISQEAFTDPDKLSALWQAYKTFKEIQS